MEATYDPTDLKTGCGAAARADTLLNFEVFRWWMAL
jgi:hypothetical protein